MFSFSQKNNPFEIENFALKFSLEWGENLGKDILERLQKKFPELTNSEIEYYQNLCKNIQNDCWKLADYQSEPITVYELDKRLKEDIFQKYDWINKSNQATIQSQYRYYFWKDGLIKS